MRKNEHTKKIALLSLCVSVALMFSYLEMQIPPLFPSVPGIKMGLANIAVIFVLYRFGVKAAAAVSLVRILIMMLLFGHMMMFFYSLAGAFLSLLSMALLKKADFLSEVGISVAGGIFHNLGQVILAVILLNTAEIGYYMIVLAVTGTIAGIFVGLCGAFLMQRI